MRLFADTETSMLLAEANSAICVQSFDDSLNSAIHITYRISLRSSSLREPRDPLSKVVFFNFIKFRQRLTLVVHMVWVNNKLLRIFNFKEFSGC